MSKERVKKGIILAAGEGNRLGSLTAIRPKVLLPVNGKKQLIRYPIEALAAAGVNDVAIVVGYLGDSVIEALGNGDNFGLRLQYIYNPDYLGGNAISVYQAKAWVQGNPVVLCMGDHMIDREIVKRLLDKHTFNETLCVDYTPAHLHDLTEATKVAVNSTGYIKDIGKNLVCWDAVDTGVFLLTENFFQALRKLVQYRGTEITICDVTRSLIDQGHLFNTCDVSDCFWLDIDTKEDLDRLRR